MQRLGSTAILASGLLALTLFVTADWAAAEPSEEQVAAIKSNCRSDFLSKCRGVPRGGAEAMQCLKDNMASVSAGCQQALKAITAAVPKAPAPAPAVAKPESAPAPAPQPTPETTAKPAPAPESKPDSAAAPPPSAPQSDSAPAAPPKAAAKPPAKEATPAAKAKEPAAVETPSAPTAAKPPIAAPPADETTIIGFIPPRKKLMILKNCRKDIETHCPDVSYGEGRQLGCLIDNKASLSPDCQGALAKLTR